MGRILVVMQIVTMVALATGVAFLLAPGDASVAASAIPQISDAPAAAVDARTYADSLSEDIILHNLFTPGRSAPTRRYATTGQGSASDIERDGSTKSGSGAGFTPVLHGTAVMDRPEAAKALLQLDPLDATPRLYGPGEGAGGYRVVSIDPRSVTLIGPRGRVVLRLPQNREDNS